ncbi:MAG: glycosyltransferase family 39 protein, partial [Bacteroidales bacterium]|nr:glycosyltransferase family 39 protein [Bacteroidales bacterium]
MMKRRAAIYIFIFAMLLPLMALREFTPANELRYLNIVDDALSNGNFITFYDHGMPYADKPPLYFWFAMLLKKVFGFHSMFLLSCLLSLVPAFITSWIMDRWTESKLKGEESAAALLMLHSSVMFLASSIVLRMDMLMCMFIVLALYTFGKMYANKSGAR